MVKTFLPYPSFAQSAAVLDRQRLGKQRVEVLQILNAVTGRSKGWSNHPATKMWEGHADALATYGLYICSEWRGRGYDPGISESRMRNAWDVLHRRGRHLKLPSWFGDPDFHHNHREILVFKNPAWYLPRFKEVEEEIFIKPDAIWPTPDKDQHRARR